MSDTPDQHQCVNAERCRAYNPVTKHAAHTPDPICADCLTIAERDIRALLYDYLDLAQLQQPTLSQAINDQPGGIGEAPIPLRLAPEALQAEIVHVVTTWEIEVRARNRLSDPPTNVRPGNAVQRAITVLAPRLRILSLIEPTAVHPTGVEDQPEDVAGYEAVWHLQDLHRRARGHLGRSHRTIHLPGGCPPTDNPDQAPCDGQLFRDEPRYPADPCPVYCGTCGYQITQEQYEAYIGALLNPRRPAA